MSAALVECAIADVSEYGKAILKFISANDVGLTGGHQRGYYLPKKDGVWQWFTPHGPKKGRNDDHPVKVTWEDGRTTDSCVKWYGLAKNEYRLTRFGRDFPYLDHDCVGSLLILVIKSICEFKAYVVDTEEDIEAIQSGLGVEVVARWAAFDASAGPIFEESPDDCLDRRFRTFTLAAKTFPSTSAFSNEARAALENCIKRFLDKPTDEQLMACVEAEYDLFRMVERKICEPDVMRLFTSIDDFLETAQVILQRRKSRAGKSLENHVETLLTNAGIKFDRQPKVEKTKPDILIPGKKEYLDGAFPVEKLFVVGVKTTCKDRWRQVTREAKRVRDKHILTIQAGISPNQLDEMEDDHVTLIVPKKLHSSYPRKHQPKILAVEQFIEVVRKRLA